MMYFSQERFYPGVPRLSKKLIHDLESHERLSYYDNQRVLRQNFLAASGVLLPDIIWHLSCMLKEQALI
jgi:hypothetical protein